VNRPLALSILGAAVALSASAADITGTWNFRVTSPQGEHTARLKVTQQGEKLTGAFQSDRGEFKVEGTLKGDQIELSIHYTGGDAPANIPFRGKLEDDDTMKGRYTAGDAGGEWTATRVKQPDPRQ
jgi:hypothetical protein